MLNRDKDLRLASHVIIEPHPLKEGWVVLKNLVSGRDYALPDDKIGLAPFAGKASDITFQFLIAEGFLITPEKEESLIQARINQLAYGCSDYTARAVLNPTQTCQLACVYCSQEAVRKVDKPVLGPDKIASLMAGRLSLLPAKRWSITVSGGGEPFIAHKWLLDVLTALRDQAGQHGAKLVVKAVTNGAYNLASILDEYESQGILIDGLLITDDGPDHDQLRPFAGGKPSRQIIHQTIRQLVGRPKTKLTVNTNIPKPGVKTSAQILDYYKETLLQIKELGVLQATFSFLMHEVPIGQSGRLAGKYLADTQELAELTIKLTDLVFTMGLSIDMGGITGVNCSSFQSSNAGAFDSAGNVGFCSGVMEGELLKDPLTPEAQEYDFRLGAAKEAWRTHCKLEDGRWCAYLLTVCNFGGCRLPAIAEGYDWRGTVACNYNLFDAILRHHLRKKYSKL
jgi:sulfatase maturation enzyme AslB (radical SAM superfamily)